MQKISTLAMAALMAAGTSVASAAELPKVSVSRAARVLEMINDVISQQPEGDYVLMSKEAVGYNMEGMSLVSNTVYGSVVGTVDAGDTFYFNNPVSQYPSTNWVKASVSGSKLTFSGAQAIAEDMIVDGHGVIMYVVPMLYYVYDQTTGEGTYVVDPNMNFEMEKGADGVYRSTDSNKLLGICYQVDEGDGYPVWAWTGYGDTSFSFSKFEGETIKLPESAKPADWMWISDGSSHKVSVAVDGSDIYVAGMDPGVKEGWAKGTVQGGKVTFTSGQYLGINEERLNFSYLFGATVTEQMNAMMETYLDADMRDKVVFDYDAAAEKLSVEGTNGYVINGSKSISCDYLLHIFSNVTMINQHRNPDALPATPYDLEWQDTQLGTALVAEIPNTDADGKYLDENNLYYEIYVDGDLYTFTPAQYTDLTEDLTKIPFNLTGYDFYVEGTDHTIYLYLDGFENIGIRSAYLNENGEWIYSKTAYLNDNGVESIGAGLDVTAEEYFDATGSRISRDARGIQLVRRTYSDGSVRTVKRMVR